VVIEATGTAEKIEGLLAALKPFGIKELVQSGLVAMARGGRAIIEQKNR
jgi:acetolactate synthase-1/3 small subunit